MAPTRNTSSTKNRRKRSVYIIARPTTIAGHLSSLSQGKFPLCHWGLLVSTHSESDLQTRCTMLNLVDDTTALEGWGTLFELIRTEAGNKPQIKEFGPGDLLREWGHACIAYVGKTKSSDHSLSMEGISLGKESCWLKLMTSRTLIRSIIGSRIIVKISCCICWSLLVRGLLLQWVYKRR
jgi:hypothetical protein